MATTTTSDTWIRPSDALASLLDQLPHEGEQVLFAGRTGALHLTDGRVLLVTPHSSGVVEAVEEPPDNVVWAPDARQRSQRPRYLDEVPLFSTPALEVSREGDGLKARETMLSKLWSLRAQPDDYVHQDPYTGGAIKTAQALRRATLDGIAPLGLSYRLRFGDPEDPEVCYQLKKAVEGIADAARMFRIPVISGELTVYAAVGLHPVVELECHGERNIPLSPAFQHDGDGAFLVGRMSDDLSGSLMLAVSGGPPTLPPPIDLVQELRVQEFMQSAVSARLLSSGMDCARGGLLVTLTECCLAGASGVQAVFPESWSGLRNDGALFGEAQSRFLVSAPSGSEDALREMASPLDVPLIRLGTVGGDRVTIAGLVDLRLSDLAA